SWLVLFGTLGYLYSFGVYEDFYALEYLSNHSPSSIAWIGSFQLMISFALGIVCGKLFDNGHFHAVEIAGGVIFTFSLFMLSLAKPFHQRLGMGIGLGLIFVPSVSITAHHFAKRRSLATGIVLSGSSVGATLFPISERLCSHLIPKIGFGSAVRASAYLVLGCLVLGNAMMRTRPRPARTTPDVKSFFTDGDYLWAIVGRHVSAESGFAVIYIQLFSVQHSVTNNLAFYSIAIINGASVFGRVAATYFADKHGPFNLHVACTLITAGTIWAVFGIHDSATIVAVSTLYGIFSGAWLALSIACIASLARNPDEVGARTGIALGLSSFGSLASAPIQGALLTRDFLWIRPVAFSAVGLVPCYPLIFLTVLCALQSIMIASAGCFVCMSVLARKRGVTRQTSSKLVPVDMHGIALSEPCSYSSIQWVECMCGIAKLQ
ncbi:major facilitator superfamily domain-containing protein, partial [Mycena epipterygia]